MKIVVKTFSIRCDCRDEQKSCVTLFSLWSQNKGWYIKWNKWYWYFINATTTDDNDDNTPASSVTVTATTNKSSNNCNNYNNNNVIIITKMKNGCALK